jgi:monoamine oxidase
MARTAFFAAAMRGLKQGAPFGPRALSRRHFLITGAAALAACHRPPANARETIAIIGAGAAGLTAAYRLAKAGRRVTLYEASNRIGGRMFTRRNFNEAGQFCELGGELVDTNHQAIRALATEMNVPIDPLEPEGAPPGEEVYHIGGQLYRQRDMLDPATGKGAFAGLAPRIAEDREKLLMGDAWTDHARALDQVSLTTYLAGLGNYAPRWAMTLLNLAYHDELGIPANEQSALNLIDFVGLETNAPFAMFGDSDEAFRIRGGSSTLTDTLATKLPASVERRMGWALASLAQSGAGVALTFDTPEGRVTRDHARVVLALPFTKLRTVQGLDALGLSEEKLRAIREYSYGDNAKLLVGTKDRPWNGAQAFPVRAAGVFFSEQFLEVWDTSRGQEGAQGILTNFLSGVQDERVAVERFRAGLTALSPVMAASLDDSKSIFMPWTRQPFTLGSYAGARVGQYTTILEHSAAPSADGRIHFAGEHTSVDFMGFMNGAVESGERAASEILA